MDKLRVTSQEIRNKKEELHGKNEEFKGKVAELCDLETTLAGQWKGDANQAFRNAFAKDKSQWDVFYNTVVKYCDALEQIAAQYDATESANVDIANARNY